MYGIPSDSDFSCLVAAYLTQVAIGENEVILAFHDERAITITTTVDVVQERGGDATRYDDAIETGKACLSFLSASIVQAIGDTGSGTLGIDWDNGMRLELLENSKQFECYIVRCGETLIVV